MERKKCYVTPLITRAQVELEDGVCNTASVMKETGAGAKAMEHETGFDNTAEGSESGFTQSEWGNN